MNKAFHVYLICILCVLVFTGRAYAGENDSPCAVPGGNSAAAPGAPLCDELYAADFDAALQWLSGVPPLVPGDAKREAVLTALDPALLVPDASKMKTVGKYFHARIGVFLDDFEKTKVSEGVAIWKLYNHSEFIRSRESTIVTDLIQGFDEIMLSEAELDRIVAGADAMLLSHEHGDHADIRVVKKFIAAGKPVYAPNIPAWWKGDKHAGKINVIREGTFSIKGEEVRVFPAFQKTTPNNVYLLTFPGGLTLMHLGDDNETVKMGQEWFRKIKPAMNIDILIPNCWCPNLALLLKYVHPGIMISSHENELGHPVEGRREYGELYPVLRTVGVPFIVPAWGEKYEFKKAKE